MLIFIKICTIKKDRYFSSLTVETGWLKTKNFGAAQKNVATFRTNQLIRCF